MDYFIELKNVCFSAQDRNIVEDITVNFAASKATAIVGPSGSGKSTVLKIAAGLLVPSEGEVYYKGKNIAAMNRQENLDFRRESSFVFQDSALWANQNLNQILELPLKIHYPQMTEKERVKKINQVAQMAGYKKTLDIRPARLSMGEQKLIAFARAMLCDPSVLFLDEWTESLDEHSQEHLIGIVRKKKNEGASILFVSHDMRIIRDLADYVLMVVDGKTEKLVGKDQIKNEILNNELLINEVTS